MRHYQTLFLICLSAALAASRAVSQEAAAVFSKQAMLLQTFVDEFVRITPGRGKYPQSFEMGSTHADQEQPVHRVSFDGEFSIGKYEVPQNLYEAVMGKNPSRWQGPRNSAERMTWHEANDFCTRVTGLLRDAKLIDEDEVVRLPSEAEWEYCCRAGTTTAYSFGDRAAEAADTGHQASLLDPYAWHTGNAAGNDPEVGELKPNAWGLYDMHGYLWEYTADDWHDSYADAPADGTAWTSGNAESRRKAVRGGSWKDPSPRLRSAARRPFATDARDDAVGFRCVRAKTSSRE